MVAPLDELESDALGEAFDLGLATRPDCRLVDYDAVVADITVDRA